MAEEQHSSTGARVMRAIHEHRLGEVAEQLLEDGAPALTDVDRRLLEAARQACADIREQLVAEARAMIERLSAANVPCAFGADAAVPRYPQYHEFTLDIEAEHFMAASRVAEAAGYWHPLLDDARAWADLPRARQSFVLKRPDDSMTRVELRWGRTPGVAARLRAGLAGAWRRARPAGPRRTTERALGGFLGTPRPLLAELFAFTDLTRDDVLLDLGCGDGRVLVEAVRRTGCRGIGIERDARIQALATAAVARHGLGDRIEILLADADATPLPAATVIFLFVPAASVASYVPALLRRMPPGTRLLAHEQDPITCSPAPDRSAPLIADSALTVAHQWLA